MMQPPTDAFANLGISAPTPPACSSGSSVASSTTLGLVGDIPTTITTATATDRLVVGVDFGTTYSGYVLLLFNKNLNQVARLVWATGVAFYYYLF